MNKLLNLSNLLIVALILVVAAYQIKDCSNQPEEGGIIHKIDTVYKEVKVEVPKYVPRWRTKIQPVEVPYQVEGPQIPIDTAAILSDYYAKYKTIDTLVLNYPDSVGKVFGYGVLTDVITKNTIVERSAIWSYKIPVVTHTIIIPPKPRAQVYIGAMANVNSVQILSSVSGALLYKTKKDRIYIANIGAANNGSGVQPFIGGGIVWKITLKKPKITDIVK